MVLNHNGSAVLAAVSVLSLVLALSVYYVVDNIARPAEDAEYRNNSDDLSPDIPEKPKVANPLTEILYNQLFRSKPVEICPIYFSNVCKWNLIGDENTTEDENNTNTTKEEVERFQGMILRSCQVLGIVKYQDVCFYTGNNLYKAIPDSHRVAQILKDCSYINDNGFPCVLKKDVKFEEQIPRNVCVSDSKTLVNVLTQRCRVREKTIDPTNSSSYVPFEDIICDEETKKYRKEKLSGDEGRKKRESEEGESNQQYKSGSNKTTTGTNATAVVCHILLAALLVVSASVALYEVCRDRFVANKDQRHWKPLLLAGQPALLIGRPNCESTCETRVSTTSGSSAASESAELQ